MDLNSSTNKWKSLIISRIRSYFEISRRVFVQNLQFYINKSANFFLILFFSLCTRKTISAYLKNIACYLTNCVNIGDMRKITNIFFICCQTNKSQWNRWKKNTFSRRSHTRYFWTYETYEFYVYDLFDKFGEATHQHRRVDCVGSKHLLHTPSNLSTLKKTKNKKLLSN